MMDLRIPTGLFFSATGAVLCAMGLLAPAARARLTEVNVNLFAGAIMLLFGGLLLWLARKKT
jgi:hypothetical protein